jgi:hypothetical protein
MTDYYTGLLVGAIIGYCGAIHNGDDVVALHSGK